VQLVLRAADPTQLNTGTALIAELVDPNGLFAQDFDGRIDLSASDPWAFFPDGATAAIRPSLRGRFERPLIRASGPRELPVAVRATVSSTATGTLTATISLPVLAL
jgi:hypothetical protein